MAASIHTHALPTAARKRLLRDLQWHGTSDRGAPAGPRACSCAPCAHGAARAEAHRSPETAAPRARAPIACLTLLEAYQNWLALSMLTAPARTAMCLLSPHSPPRPPLTKDRRYNAIQNQLTVSRRCAEGVRSVLWNLGSKVPRWRWRVVNASP